MAMKRRLSTALTVAGEFTTAIIVMMYQFSAAMLVRYTIPFPLCQYTGKAHRCGHYGRSSFWRSVATNGFGSSAVVALLA